MRKENGKALVLGCGNYFGGDDSIGLIAVKLLLEKGLPERYDVRLTQAPMDDLLAFTDRYDRIFLIDAMVSGNHPPGTVRKLDEEQLPRANFRTFSGHTLSLAEAMDYIRQVEQELRLKLVVLGIEIKNPQPFSTSLSEELSSQLPKILKNLTRELIEPELKF